MATARDHAADLLWTWDRSGTWLRTHIAERRAALNEPRERALLTELAMGTVRRQGTLDAVLAAASRRPLKVLHGAVRTALRLGLYQMLFLDRIPTHAAVDHAVRWARAQGGPKRAGFVNGVLRNIGRGIQGPSRGADDPRRDVLREDGSRIRMERAVFDDPAKDEAGNLAGRLACPRWLVVRWLEQWGRERTEDILRAGITRPSVCLRARGDRDELVTSLRDAGADARHGPLPTAVLVPSVNASVHDAIDDGRAWVQDASSQRVAPLLDLEAGHRVLDLCAAPGGKTVHCADLMQSGTIVACDVDAEKLEGLRKLSGVVAPVELVVEDVPTEGPLPLEEASFNAVLIDAPCSNTAVLRRRVEARWRLEPEHIKTLADLQLDLLRRALPLLTPGGTLVYSTCSLEPEENEEVIERLVAEHAGLQAEIAHRVFPSRETDGGFAAVIRA